MSDSKKNTEPTLIGQVTLFKPEDFPRTFFRWQREVCAELCNTKLNAYLQCLDKVYGDSKLGSYHGKPLMWTVDEKETNTHTARIISVERQQGVGS